jgi:hypothetical protein
MGDMGVESVELMMSKWLSRAGNCPLSISMESDATVKRDIWDTFFSFSSQWRHIRINSLAPTEFPHELEVPLLETFELIVRDFSSEFAQKLSSMLHWSSASSLRQVEWSNSGYKYHRLGLDWSQLTHLTLNTSMSVEDCLDILENSQLLTHAAFQSVTLQTLPSSRNLIYLCQLRSLGFCADQNISSLLDALVLPNILEFIFIAATIQEGLWPHASFLSLVDRSSCALKYLYLHYVLSTTEELLDCLRCTQSSLKQLTLQACGGAIVTDEVLDVLTAKDGTCLCPKLQELALYDCISCSPGRVAGMVNSRLNTTPMPLIDPRAVARIQAVEMFDHEPELGPLKDLQRQGLILKVYSTTGVFLGLSPEDLLRLPRLEEDEDEPESILRNYGATTGQFWQLGF